MKFFCFTILLALTLQLNGQKKSLELFDARIGLKIRGFGYDWRNVDSYLQNNGYHALGDNPLVGFSFPLEFTFIYQERQIPIGFSFSYTSGGTFSKKINSNDYTRLRADNTSFGVYKTITINRLFIRGNFSFSRINLRLFAFTEVNPNSQVSRFIGGEFNSKAESIDGSLQLGISTKGRLQYGFETGYQHLINSSIWTLVPNIPTNIPIIRPSERSIFFGPFIYIKMY
jgi:hypothetical protein